MPAADVGSMTMAIPRITGETVLDPSTSGLRLSDACLAEISTQLSFAPADPCASCGGLEQHRVADVDRYGFPLAYVACRDCGLLFANPYYDAASLDRFYASHYAPIYGRTAHPDKMFSAERERGRRVAKLLKRHARATGRKFASCLDVGCSHGGFLAALPTEWVRVGYDYDESLFRIGRARGLELHPIAALDGEKRQFDVVMANQVLEHTAEPVAFLRRLVGFLAPGGVIYIEVPGLRAPSAAHIDVKLMFKNAHRWMFEADTFQAMAACAGLRCVYLNEEVQALLVPGVADQGMNAHSAYRTLDYLAMRAATGPERPSFASRCRRLVHAVLRRVAR